MSLLAGYGLEEQDHMIVISRELWIKIHSINGNIGKKIGKKIEFN